LGGSNPVFADGKYASAQAISGTGALRYGAELIARFMNKPRIYISNPTWINHKNIFNDCGLEVSEYRYWHAPSNGLDFQGMLADIDQAPEGSVFVLHACAHNPTGVDPTKEQWAQIAQHMKAKKHVTFFDSAYQGFASGDLDQDAYAVRLFTQEYGLEVLVAQSYSKNFGLYGERCGCLVVTCDSQATAKNIVSQIAKIARPMISNPPAFGARIVELVLTTPALEAEWRDNLRTMSSRIISMRHALLNGLTKLQTPGTWTHITDQIGMFSYTGLTPKQVQLMKEKFHVYMSGNGRVSMAGLNEGNVEWMAKAVDEAVRAFPKSSL
jgi:aspartate aminotransferase